MIFRKVFFLIVLSAILSLASFAKSLTNNQANSVNDTLSAVSGYQITNDTTFSEIEELKQPDITDYGPSYYLFLDKADKAYNMGMFNRAKKFYLKAAEINPNSLYITYRLNEIDKYKGSYSRIIFFFNFDKPDLLIQSLTALVAYFIVSMILLLLVILGNRRRMENIEKRKQAEREIYQELLVDYLFTEANNEIVINRLKNEITSHFNRKLLIDQMIDLSINLTGDAKDKLRKLYLYLSLDKDSVAKAYSYKWHIKVKGFRELAFMDITDANEEIIRCLSSNNDVLRMEAQLALIRLNHEDPFGFLDYLDKPFSLWEQLTTYETITYHNIPIPLFDKWLFSRNKSVVIFALRMIDIFKQKETYPNLFWMLVNEDPEIRYHVIRVIGNLKIKEALPHLKRLYKTENYTNCLAILQAIAKMPDESVLNFLKLVIDKEDDVQLQIEAAIAINNAGEIGKQCLEKLLQSDYKNYQIIVKHVLDKRIN